MADVAPNRSLAQSTCFLLTLLLFLYATWLGLRSGAFESGRLSHLEKPIWQFNQWWLDRMDLGV